jgi:hypothetical protein
MNGMQPSSSVATDVNSYLPLHLYCIRALIDFISIYRMFSAQADWILTHTAHKYTEHSTIEVYITLDGVTQTDPLIRWSPNE